jgi:hypothetical protein
MWTPSKLDTSDALLNMKQTQYSDNHIWHHIHINTKFPVEIYSFHTLGGKTSFWTLIIFVCSFFFWDFPDGPKILPICYLLKLQVVQLWYKTIPTKNKSCFASLQSCAPVFLPPPFPFFCLGEGHPLRKHLLLLHITSVYATWKR